MRSSTDLAPSERADHLDFAATLLAQHGFHACADAAKSAAQALREAESAQGCFTAHLFAIKTD